MKKLKLTIAANNGEMRLNVCEDEENETIADRNAARIRQAKRIRNCRWRKSDASGKREFVRALAEILCKLEQFVDLRRYQFVRVDEANRDRRIVDISDEARAHNLIVGRLVEIVVVAAQLEITNGFVCKKKFSVQIHSKNLLDCNFRSS